MRFDKWIELSFGYDGDKIHDTYLIAKEHMQVISCYKADMQMGFNIVLEGTKKQWETLKCAWAEKGIYSVRKKWYWH